MPPYQLMTAQTRGATETQVTDWRTMVNFTILIAAMMTVLASARGEL
jgi:hypothetical protein